MENIWGFGTDIIINLLRSDNYKSNRDNLDYKPKDLASYYNFPAITKEKAFKS